MGEGPGCSSGKLSHMREEKSEILMQSRLEMNPGPWGKSPWLMPLRSHGPPGKPVVSGSSLNKAQVSKLQKGKGGADAFVPGFGTHQLCLFSGTRGETELWPESDMQAHCEIPYFSGPQFPHLYKWGNDTMPSGRLLPLPTPWEIHSRYFLSPGENCHPKKKWRKFCSKEVFQILKEVWGVLGLLQHHFRLKWQISIILQSSVYTPLCTELVGAFLMTSGLHKCLMQVPLTTVANSAQSPLLRH